MYHDNFLLIIDDLAKFQNIKSTFRYKSNNKREGFFRRKKKTLPSINLWYNLGIQQKKEKALVTPSMKTLLLAELTNAL